MADITAELVSVERLLWSGQASMVTAETTEGEIGVLPGHEPMIGQLIDNGVVTIHPVDGERRVAAVQGGFLSVTQTRSPSSLIGPSGPMRWMRRRLRMISLLSTSSPSPVARPHSVQFAAPRLNTLDW